MRPKDRQLASQLTAAIEDFSQKIHPLPGMQNLDARHAFVEQILESIHRVQYVRNIKLRNISPLRANATSPIFDPLKAAEFHRQQGNIDEAFWLVFLSVHFGKHRREGWRRVRDVYGALNDPAYWTWNRIIADFAAFRNWLANNRSMIGGYFGNHRKYQSLDANSPTGTGAAIQSYVDWVSPPRTHDVLFNEVINNVAGDPRRAFNLLYHSMSSIASFGRMARFDYLAMIGKLELALIEPDSTYMDGATGPFIGANLLLNNNLAHAISRRNLDALLIQLGAALGINMQVMEDAICNWQKSPNRFIPFRG